MNFQVSQGSFRCQALDWTWYVKVYLEMTKIEQGVKRFAQYWNRDGKHFSSKYKREGKYINPLGSGDG